MVYCEGEDKVEDVVIQEGSVKMINNKRGHFYTVGKEMEQELELEQRIRLKRG